MECDDYHTWFAVDTLLCPSAIKDDLQLKIAEHHGLHETGNSSFQTVLVHCLDEFAELNDTIPIQIIETHELGHNVSGDGSV